VRVLADSVSLTTLTGVVESPTAPGVRFGVSSPCRGRLSVRYVCASPGQVALALFDVSGARVLQAWRRAEDRGTLTVETGSLSAGSYLLRISGPGLCDSRSVHIIHP
jgi:hypothetical protein